MAKQREPQDAETRLSCNDSKTEDSLGDGTKSDVVKDLEIASIPPLPTDDAMFHEFMDQEDLAIAWVEEYFPYLIEKLDFRKLQVENCEFFNEELRKRVADVVYSIPYRDGSTVLKLTIILEHKSQSSPKRNRATIAQTLVYLAEYCLREALKTDSKTTITQPIPVIVYTGPNEKLEKIDWQKCFPLPYELKKYELPFAPEFINMTSLRRQGRLPKNPFLKVMYDVMTRSKASEFEGYGKTALQPLSLLPDKWTEREKRRAIELIFFFSASVKKLRVPNAREIVAELFSSINLEEKMGRDLLYEVVAPRAEQWGIEKERNNMLNSQRSTLRSIVKERFGSCPVSLRNALNKIRDLEELINLRVYALTQAQSLDDLLENAKNAVR